MEIVRYCGYCRMPTYRLMGPIIRWWRNLGIFNINLLINIHLDITAMLKRDIALDLQHIYQ